MRQAQKAHIPLSGQSPAPFLYSLILCLMTAGCASPSWYSQAISGHYALMDKREDIQSILDDPATDAERVRELELALQIREFAVERLHLPDNDSYTQFVETGQDAVAWNVVAAPEFSLDARKWCFLVSGCLPYRGYFKREPAEKFATRLENDGYDTAISPAIAYSTLGWFDDPMMDTMFRYSDEQLAAFIFHELAHQQLYVKGDGAFSEGYASFVEETGVALWLESTGQAEKLPGWRKREKAGQQMDALLRATRGELAALYASDLPEKTMREQKSKVFDRLRDAYESMVEDQWNGHSYYASLIDAGPNNARLALVGTYRGGACAFRNLYRSANGEMHRFQRLAAEKAGLPAEQRSAWLDQPCEAIASGSDL